jgi:hypothetical protein
VRCARLRQLACAVVRRAGLAQVYARATEELRPVEDLQAGGDCGAGGDPILIRRRWAR